MTKKSTNKVFMSDQELVDLALNNDQKAFSLLVERYKKSITTYIQGYVSQNNDIEDLCQESFDKAFRNLSGYSNEFAFSTWLYRIAQNSCFDFYRKKKLSLTPIIDFESNDRGHSCAGAVPSPEDNLISEQTFDELKKSIESLDEIYREVATLRFIHEYAYEEIAVELNIPINTVRTRLKRAKNILNNKWKS